MAWWLLAQRRNRTPEPIAPPHLVSRDNAVQVTKTRQPAGIDAQCDDVTIWNTGKTDIRFSVRAGTAWGDCIAPIRPGYSISVMATNLTDVMLWTTEGEGTATVVAQACNRT